MLQALASRILGHAEPRSYAEFLRQRVETNYLVGALMVRMPVAYLMSLRPEPTLFSIGLVLFLFIMAINVLLNVLLKRDKGGKA